MEGQLTFKFFEWMLFAGLSVLTIILVNQAYNEYLEGKTFLSTSFENFAESDQPTVTFCMASRGKLVYGVDFVLEIMHNDQTSTVLNRGTSEVNVWEYMSNTTTTRIMTLEDRIRYQRNVNGLRIQDNNCVAIKQSLKTKADSDQGKKNIFAFKTLTNCI